ncbi:MAG: hypothetical protein WCI73_12830, partial [Phycisphaerae bacterium]
LRSGLYDWVLVEITQAVEYRPEAADEVPGQMEMEATDPSFTLAHLEDRASVMFWRRMAADRLGKVDPLRKLAEPGYLAALEGGLSPRPPRQYYGECAVGSVDTRRIVREAQEERAIMEIRWSGRQYQVDEKGITHTGENIVGRWIFVLMRKTGIKAKLELAVSSAHCPACGAPETDLTADACPFCQKVLNDGSFDWVLVESLPANTPAALQLLSAGSKAPRAAETA